MLEQQIGDIELNLVFWVFVNFIVRFFSGMRNSTDGPKPQNGVVSRSTKSPFRAISSYFRIVSSGASTVARSAVSVASSIVERDDESSHDQVLLLVYLRFCFWLIKSKLCLCFDVLEVEYFKLWVWMCLLCRCKCF